MEFNAYVNPTQPQSTDFGDEIFDGMPSGWYAEVVTQPVNGTVEFASPTGWRFTAPSIPGITGDGIQDSFQFRFTDGTNHGETQTATLWLLLGN